MKLYCWPGPRGGVLLTSKHPQATGTIWKYCTLERA